MSSASLFDSVFRGDRSTRIAILFEQRAITYAELREATLRAVTALLESKISPGYRVAILLHDSPEFVSAFLAIISLGAIAVPINMALSSREQLFILKDCGARAAIIEINFAAKLFADSNPETSELRTLLLVRGEEASLAVSHLDVSRFDDPAYQPADAGLLVQDDESRDAFILYTSGSTGEPKGAVHSQADIFYTNQTYCSEVLRLREGDRMFSASRLPFAYGLGNALTFPLLNGFTTVLCRDKPTPEVVARIFQVAQPTIFFAVPVVYRMLLQHHHTLKEIDTSSLRLCVSAGEALPAHLGQEWQKIFGVEVLDGIGSTEMLHMFMSNHEREVRYGSSGRLLRGYQARLLDHEGKPTASGEVGNLWVSGKSAAARYWERPDATAQSFVDGWVRTGDLYRCDRDGYWWHMGRSDDCFKPTGQWVSPVEVESVLLRSDEIRAAAVVEGFDEDGLSCVCAFVVAASEPPDIQTVEQSLRALCQNALPRFKQPRRYFFISELPYTATGKVQRFKLREQLRAQGAVS